MTKLFGGQPRYNGFVKKNAAKSSKGRADLPSPRASRVKTGMDKPELKSELERDLFAMVSGPIKAHMDERRKK